jgi:hypothetical protein
MSPSLKQKKAIPVFPVALVLACFAISRSAQAAEPSGVQNVSQFNPPYRHSFSLFMNEGEFGATQKIALPAGKTLVVEFVSARAELPAGEQPILLRIESLGGLLERETSLHDLLWNFVGRVAGQRDVFIASQQIRFYAVEGELIEISATRNTGEGFFGANVDITGYLVTTP